MSSYYNWKTDEFQRDRKYRRTRYKNGPGQDPSNPDANGSNTEQLQQLQTETVPLLYSRAKIFIATPTNPLDEAQGIPIDLNDTGTVQELKYEHPPGTQPFSVQFSVQLDTAQAPDVNYRYSSEISNPVPNINIRQSELITKPDRTFQGFSLVPESAEDDAEATYLLKYIIQSAPTEQPAWIRQSTFRFVYKFVGQTIEPTNASGDPTTEEEDQLPADNNVVSGNCDCPPQTNNQLLQNDINSQPTNGGFMHTEYLGIVTNTETGKKDRRFKICTYPSPYGRPRNNQTGFAGTETIVFDELVFLDNPSPTPTYDILPEVLETARNQCWTILISSDIGQNIGRLVFKTKVEDPYQQSGVGAYPVAFQFDCPPGDAPPVTTFDQQNFFISATDMFQPGVLDATENPWPSSVIRIFNTTTPPYYWSKNLQLFQGTALRQAAFFTLRSSNLSRGNVPFDGNVKWVTTKTSVPPGCDIVTFFNQQLPGVNVYFVYDGTIFDIETAPAFVDVSATATCYNGQTQDVNNVFKEITTTWRIFLSYGGTEKNVTTKTNPKVLTNTIDTGLIDHRDTKLDKLIQNFVVDNDNSGDPQTDGIWSNDTFEGLTLLRGSGGNNTKNVVTIPYWNGNYTGTNTANVGIRTGQDLATVPGGATVLSKDVKVTGPQGSVNTQWITDSVPGSLYRTNFSGGQAAFDAILDPGFNLLELELDLPASPGYSGLPINGMFTRLPPGITAKHYPAPETLDHSVGKLTWKYTDGYGNGQLIQGPQNLVSDRFHYKVPLKIGLEDTLTIVWAGSFRISPDDVTFVDMPVGTGFSGNLKSEMKMIEGTHYRRDEFFAYFVLARKLGGAGVFAGTRQLRYQT